MRVFYENLATTVEHLYSDKCTLENVLYLEDIIPDIKTDIYVQYKYKSTNTVTYTYGSIDLAGVIKVRNHLYFINHHRDKYINYIEFENNIDNKVQINVTNVNTTGGDPLTADILVNGVVIETLEYTDEYTLNNNKSIQIDSVLLGTAVVITLPLFMVVGEYVEYTANTIQITEEAALHKYLCTFDRINNGLVFDRKYTENGISILCHSKGSILRSSTINELYTLNNNAFVQYNENNNRLIIPIEKMFKSGDVLKYIRTQYVQISPALIPIGYNLLGIYLDNADVLTYDPIMNNTNYATLVESINNHNLDTIRKDRNYYGFIIGLNNINTFTAIDVYMYGLGAGGGSGGGVNKIVHEFTNVEELIIEYVAGTQVPTVVVFDSNGNQVIPEQTHYNLNNEIKITLGEVMTGLVSII